MSTSARPRSVTGLATGLGLLYTPLRRGTDRLEITARWLAVVAFMVSLVATVSVSGATEARMTEEAERMRAESYRTTAVLLEDPVTNVGHMYGHPVRARARASWVTRFGSPVEARIDVPTSAHRGDRMRLLVGADGLPTAPPPSAAEIAAVSLFVALQLPAMAVLGGWLWLGFVRRLLEAPRQRYWENAWRAFDGSGSTPQR